MIESYSLSYALFANTQSLAYQVVLHGCELPVIAPAISSAVGIQSDKVGILAIVGERQDVPKHFFLHVTFLKHNCVFARVHEDLDFVTIFPRLRYFAA
jgi:hypothetical protein